MKLRIYKALWGMDHLPLDRQFEMIAKAGYAGVEAPLPGPETEARFRELLQEHGLGYTAMVFTDDDHKQSFKAQVERAATFSPQLINAHSSKDDMPYDQQLDFYRFAVEVERDIGIPIAHETHRGRAMFTPWATEQLLKDVSGLNLCADFSHWCNVCESLLENQTERMKLASARSIHIHSRVGYAEGPQVNHPAAPEHEAALAAHAVWWSDIVRNRRDQGAKQLIVVPEFGPPGYLQTLPFTNQPVSDLWEVCLWMKGYIERNWSGWLNS